MSHDSHMWPTDHGLRTPAFKRSSPYSVGKHSHGSFFFLGRIYCVEKEVHLESMILVMVALEHGHV